MQRTIISYVALCLAVTVGHRTKAQDALPPNTLEQNAALSYWQAFALMPPVDDALQTTLGEAVSGNHPLDDELRKLLDSSENALFYLHRGAGISKCAWGLAYETGPYCMLPHLSKARVLARIALLRARARFEANDPSGAMSDIIDAMTLGRHAGQEGVIILISILVDYAIEFQAIDTIAEFLPRLSDTQRQSLKRRLTELPAQVGMQKALIGEKQVLLSWLIREAGRADGKEQISEQIIGSISPIDAELKKQVESATDGQLLQWANDLKAAYDAGADYLRLPPDQAMAKERDLMARLKDEEKGNPLGAAFLPSIGNARRAEVRYLTRHALLQTAFAVLQDGKDVLSRPEYRDPFGDGPFAYRKTDSGFELVSDIIIKDADHVTLKVGAAEE